MENVPLSSDESDYDKPKTNIKSENLNLPVDNQSVKISQNAKNQQEVNNDNDNHEKQKLISQVSLISASEINILLFVNNKWLNEY